jgi:hypothetical protein
VVRETFARRAMSSMVRRSNWVTQASSRQMVDALDHEDLASAAAAR